MSVEESLLAQLAEHPEDDVTRLVYADWLEERDDARAEYLRAEVELGGVFSDILRAEAVQAQLRELRAGLDPDWLLHAGKRFDVWLFGYPPVMKIAVIKVIRELTGCGLAEAKAISESLPRRVVASATLAAAELTRERLARP